jgi:hypothetical protein
VNGRQSSVGAATGGEGSDREFLAGRRQFRTFRPRTEGNFARRENRAHLRVNHLAPAPVDDPEDGAVERYLLPKHAHIVVYEREAQPEDDAGENDESDDAGENDESDDAGENDGSDDAGENDESDDTGASQLVTIYDCGAAQKPPSAQLLGQLGSVRAACETTRNPTGYVVSMREPSVLVDEDDGQYVVRPR